MGKNVLVCLLLVAGSAGLAQADTIRVGPTRMYRTVQAGYTACNSGDTIEIDSATYFQSMGWVYVNGKSDVTFRGVGATRPILDGGGSLLNGKGIFVIETGTNNITIENLEIRNTRFNPDVAGSNAAGVRAQGSGLTLRNCYIHDCDDGVLNGGGDMLFEYCEFYHNGEGDGQSHNIYIGAGTNSFTMQYCYSHGTVEGHEVKTRANNNYILYNLIITEGTGSREIQYAQGGNCYAIGNVVVKGPNAHNDDMIAYGGEGTNGNPNLYVVNNTLISYKSWASGLVVNNPPTTAIFQNNILQTVDYTVTGSYASSVVQTSNWPTGNAYLVNSSIADLNTFDAHLTGSSTGAINLGSIPSPSIGTDGTSLIPTLQYVTPRSYQTRTPIGTIDIGAYEYGIAPPVNQAPIVTVGSNQSILWPADTVTLTGTATDDGLPINSTLYYTWSQVSGPAGGVIFSDPSDVVTASPFSITATFSSPGTYVLQLQAGDTTLTSAPGTVTVTVINNNAPVVSAGSDQTILTNTLPASVTLNGTATDDGLPNPPGALTITWSQTSGPAGGVTFANPNIAATTATVNAWGIYVLQLSVYDGQYTTNSQVTISVLSPPTVQINPPVPSFVYETWPVTLACTASNVDGYPLTYAWVQTAGLNIPLTGATTASISFTVPYVSTQTEGAMAFETTVSDGMGNTASAAASLRVYMIGDTNHDNYVNVGDLQTLVTAWGSYRTPPSGNWNAWADLNNDGYVNVGDLQLLVGNWNRNLPS